MKDRVLITGANRGIGLELARHYARQGAAVMAGCRKSSPELKNLATESSVEIFEGLDVQQKASIDQWSQTVQAWRQGEPISLLVNNAGLLHRESLDAMDEATIEAQFQVNALGPVRVTSAILPQLQEGSKVAMITSRMGSIADNSSGSYYGYRMSKAALNAASVSFAHDLKPRKISVCIVHPGHVQTEMTGNTGDVTPAQSAQAIAQRVQELTLERSGQFVHAQGQALPW